MLLICIFSPIVFLILFVAIRSIKKQELLILTKKQEILAIKEKKIFAEYKDKVKTMLDKIEEEKTIGFPWLANAIADGYVYYDLIFAKYLQEKSHPAKAQAEKIKEISAQKRRIKSESLKIKYILEYYESVFPWLIDYVGSNSSDLIQPDNSHLIADECDPVLFYTSHLPQSEYQSLSIEERNQKALDRYWKSSKSPWKIGRDYERFIGYLYEKEGYQVQYHGIEKGKGDLGRDLICSKSGVTKIIQCKYWSMGHLIRENHITQLYGTTIQYVLNLRKENNEKIQIDFFPDFIREKNIVPILVTTGELSDTAKEFAELLGIKVDKILMDKSYPCIKCNINPQSQEKIYHLPFDQQYDHTKIIASKGEKWVCTTKEAESLGFRRAFKWSGNPREPDES